MKTPKGSALSAIMLMMAILTVLGTAAEFGTVPVKRAERLPLSSTIRSQQPIAGELERDRNSAARVTRDNPDGSPKAAKKPVSTDADEDRGRDYADAQLPNTMDGLNDKRPLGIGDRISFKVVEDEGAPRSLTIADSNEMDVPYIGRVTVGNKTCKQFAYYVKKLLEKDYYYQATVLIGLDSAGNGARASSRGRIYVMGQVRSPGTQELPVDETYTVAKAILRAGGFGPYANKRNVKLVRGGKEVKGSKPLIIDCAEILDKGLWDKDVEVSPDDVITVPERLINLF